MAKNKKAKAAMENFKMEAANEVGVNLKQGYNGDLTSKQAGSIGGQMVKKMVESYENSISSKYNRSNTTGDFARPAFSIRRRTKSDRKDRRKAFALFACLFLRQAGRPPP